MFTGLDLAGKFAKLLEELATFLTSFANQLLSIVGALRDTDLAETPYAKQIRDAVGYVPSGNSINDLLEAVITDESTIGIVNLNTLLQRLIAMHTYEGADPVGSITELRDILLGFRQQVVGPSDPTIYSALENLMLGQELSNETLVAIRDRLDILNEEVSTIRLLTLFPAEGPNIMQMTASIAGCICRLADELAPTEPPVPPEDILIGHPCADGGEPMMIIYPEDWTNIPGAGFHGVPSYINPSIADAYFRVTGVLNDEARTPVTLLGFNPGVSSYLGNYFCTVVGTDEIIDIVARTGWFFDEGEPYPGYSESGNGDDVTNVGLAAGGCEDLSIGGVESSNDAVSFEIFDDVESSPPSFTIVIYAPPN